MIDQAEALAPPPGACGSCGSATTRATWPASRSRSTTWRSSPPSRSATELVQAFRDLGFKFVTLDLEGFRSGSLNGLIPLESLQLTPTARR